jgi:hypothetical protein
MNDELVTRMITILEARRRQVQADTYALIENHTRLAEHGIGLDFHSFTDEVAQKGAAYQRLTTQLEVLRWAQNTDGMFPW